MSDYGDAARNSFRLNRLAVLALALLTVGSPIAGSAAERKIVVGSAETVRIYPGGIEFKARIDTGATTTSINARNIKRFTRGGQRWVSFEINGHSGQKPIYMERQVVRRVRVKRFGQESKSRSVVLIGICLGGYYKDAQVTLQDRRRRKFPVLIGRRFMNGAIIVDPSKEYTVKPDCPGRT